MEILNNHLSTTIKSVSTDSIDVCNFDYLNFPRFTYTTDFAASSAPDKTISLVVTVIKLYIKHLKKAIIKIDLTDFKLCLI